MYQDNNYSSGYSANQLHSPPPSRSNWDDRNAAATTEIPLQDTSGSPHVKFAPKSPSIIPSPVYNSPSVISSSIPMHTPVPTNDPAGTPRSRNFGTDTFAASSDKTAVESEHDGMAYDMYNKRGGEETGTSYYGNAKTSLRSDGFMRLESTDDDVAPEGYNNTRGYPPAPPPPPPAAGPPQGSAYPPFLQSAPMMMHPAAGNRSLPMRLLLGPYRVPWFSYLSALAMLIIMVMELVKNNQLTGSVISTSPYFNPLIGPSSTVLINMGARFTPCIRPLPDYTSSTTFAYCYQSQSDTCTLEQLCGFDGFGSSDVPNQSFRFITPIFLHAGIIHYIINMLSHFSFGDLERSLGTPRYTILYMASGIWGFVLSATLSQTTTVSMGCSGALFGIIGYMFVDVIVNWKNIVNPTRELVKLLIVTIISLVLGLLPGLDNFAHLGGFVTGIITGGLIAPMRDGVNARGKIFTWGIRVVALVLLIIIFSVSITQFYAAEDPSKICPNCKYLSCLPVNGWCDQSTA